MGKVQEMLSQRLKKPEASSKMAALAEQSARGDRSGFAGIFSVSDLNDTEKSAIATLLDRYSTGDQNIKRDLDSLINITSEVQAINNQAAVLHGERIKRAQTILKEYSDGAFTAWLVTTYGNRQTPYNLLQYYEFYVSMPATLRPQIESMPRQAVYTLASREGLLDDKRQIVESYAGETKAQLMDMIRERFPLEESDRRRQNVAENVIAGLKKVSQLLGKTSPRLTKKQRHEVDELMETLTAQLGECKTR